MIISTASKSKYSFLILSLLTTFCFFISCSKVEEKDPIPDNTNLNITPQKTTVKVFEIISLVVKQEFGEKYSGTFGDMAINLVKSTDTTLTFIIPEVLEGERLLKFDLAQIKFQVSKSPEVNASEIANTIFSRFDDRINEIIPASEEEITELDSMKKYKQESMTLFNSLSADQKRQAALFYEANKEVFVSFADNVYENLDATTTKRQSNCPDTDFISFYDCTSENISKSYVNFKMVTRQFLKLFACASAVGLTALNLSALGPVALGIAAVGIALPIAAAMTILVVDVWPAWVKMRNHTYDLLKSPWIFREEIFNNIKEEFTSEVSTDLNLDAGFRTMTENDNNITPNTSKFINVLNSLKADWDKFVGRFGNLPTFQSNSESTTLSETNITINNITNVNVQLVSQEGEKVKFKSLSGSDEEFKYTITVRKEGFVKDTSVNAVITNICYDINALIGSTWHIKTYLYNQQGECLEPGPGNEIFNLIVLTFTDDYAVFTFSTGETSARYYSLNGCGLNIDFFSCSHYIQLDPEVSSYEIGSCGGFCKHIYTKQ